MYVGRFVVAGPGIGAYRVSSRSFPDRTIVQREPGQATVVPTADAEPTDNPYVSYDCLRTGDSTAVVGNGSHVRPITEKCELGYPPRDALATVLLTMDFERDDYETPRLAAVVEPDRALLGIVRADALRVETVTEPHLVATYEHDAPVAYEFHPTAPGAAAQAVMDAPFEHAICAVGAAVDAQGVRTAIVD
ncbi:MAG: IMP cyclohydrolase [Halobacteriaceae archaeon]